jgi:RimJ/RimL family protein N-acetyltransferase
LCGVVYTDASPSNVIMSAVIEAPITKRFLYVCFFYPFVQLGVRHVTALVETRNAKSRKLCERLGFVVEGLMREAAKEDDVFVYGMIRRECRFL